jgi:hypothetical protein
MVLALRATEASQTGTLSHVVLAGLAGIFNHVFLLIFR